MKFRAWDTINECWVDVWKIVLAHDGSVQGVGALDGEFYGMHQVTLERYIERSNDDDVEACEGDILRMNNDEYDPEDQGVFVGTCFVNWDGTCFTYEIITNEMKHPYSLDSHSMWHAGEKGTTEVIGNIHENKDLLK